MWPRALLCLKDISGDSLAAHGRFGEKLKLELDATHPRPHLKLLETATVNVQHRDTSMYVSDAVAPATCRLRRSAATSEEHRSDMCQGDRLERPS